MGRLATFIHRGLIMADRTGPNPMVMIEDVLDVVQKTLELKRAGEIG